MTQYLTLTPKTLKDKNVFNNAGKPPKWVILETRDMVGFSDLKGPWHFVYPYGQDHTHSRWVHSTSDKDFTCERI